MVLVQGKAFIVTGVGSEEPWQEKSLERRVGTIIYKRRSKRGFPHLAGSREILDIS